MSYCYDLNGNRVSITYPGDLVVSNIFDQLNRLAAVKDWSDREIHYSYDDASSPTGTLYPVGTVAYLIEYADGTSVEVPEQYIEPA